jgi:serine/threonine-protein kinase RsbW
MADIPNVCLNLANRPENVLVVRQALTGVAETLGLDPVEMNDLNTAVTEASNNVVQHAYEGEEGPLEVEVYAQAGAVMVVVRDHGIGIRPHADGSEDGHAGIGLPVIHALTQSVEFRNLPESGTEVRMQFAANNAGPLEPLSDQQSATSWDSSGSNGTSTLEMTLAPNTVAQAVLPRVLSALAARAYFSTDRISDIQLVVDALVANAGDSISGSHLRVAVDLAPRDLELHIGPLVTGSARRLVESAVVDGGGPVIERLIDDHRVSTSNSSETLALRLIEHR